MKPADYARSNLQKGVESLSWAALEYAIRELSTHPYANEDATRERLYSEAMECFAVLRRHYYDEVDSRDKAQA